MKLVRYLILASLILAAGCGYKVMGVSETRIAPVNQLAIPMVINDTGQLRLTFWLTDQLRGRFQQIKGINLTDPSLAQAILSVKVKSVRIESSTLTSILQTSSRRIIITVDATLKSASDEKVIAQMKGLSLKDTYVVENRGVVANATAITEANEDAAVKRIAALLAEHIANYILEDF